MMILIQFISEFQNLGALHTVTISFLPYAMNRLLPVRALVPPTVRFKQYTSDFMQRNQDGTY
jgi:hypothetical protein